MKTILSVTAAALLMPSAAFAFAHTWLIQEVYTNGDGSVQFVEFLANNPSFTNEIFMNGTQLRFEISASPVNTMTFSDGTASDGSANLPGGGTLNKTVLIGTANMTSLYGLTPDYIIPANFLNQGALNSVIFSASNDRVNLTLLPTDGVMSLDGLVGNSGTTAAATAVNSQASPKNFAGNTVNIPEPGAAAVFAAVALGAFIFTRRRAR